MSPQEAPSTATAADRPPTASADGTRTAGDPATAFAPTASFAPTSIPGYLLGELIGEGGMAVVYSGRDATLGHLVAIKLIRASGIKDRVRFLAEAQALASVRHPNVVRVVTFGDAGEFPYLVMEYLPGGTLAARLRPREEWPIRAAVELIAKVARAVQAVHDEQIIHRDLKPGNILFDAAGEPKVCDFGLAKRGVGSDLTATHAILGTPAYMAPEQARGETKFVGPSADIYALGVILYECLTGERPFRAAEPLLLLKLVTEGEFAPPRRVRTDIPKDLERIVLAAMALDPADRYPTAGRLAGDLERFLAGESVSVRSPGVVERAARWAKRKPKEALVLLLTAAVVALLAVGVSLTLLWQSADSAKTEAIGSRDDAVRARGELAEERERIEFIEYGRAMQMAHQAWRDNDVSTARRLLAGTEPRFRHWEWDYLHRLTTFEVRTLAGHTEAVVGVAFDAEGERMATASWDRTVRIWHAVSGRLLLALDRFASRVWTVAFHPTQPNVLTVDDDGGARVWNADTGAAVHTFPKHEFGTRAARYSRDGSRVVTVGQDKSAAVYDGVTFAPITRLGGRAANLTAAEFLPGAEAIVGVGDDGWAKIWDATTGVEIRAAKLHAGAITGFAASPTEAKFLTAGEDGATAIWDAATLKKVVELEGASRCWLWNYSPDGRRVAGTGANSVIALWDAAGGALVRTLKGHTDQVTNVAFHPAANLVLSGSSDRTARVWSLDQEQEFAKSPRHPDEIRCIALAPNGRVFATGCADKQVRIFDADTLAAVRVFPPEPEQIQSVAFSRDGARFASACDSRIRLRTPAEWDSPPITVAHIRPGAFSSLAFDPSGSAFAVGDTAGAIDIGAVAGTPERGFRVADSRLAIAWPRGGESLVTCDARGTAGVWNSADGGKRASSAEAAVRFPFVALDSTENWVATPGRDRTVRIWNRATGELRSRLVGHSGDITGAAFSPDGKRVLTTSEDGQIKLWDPARGVEVLTLRGHTGLVSGAAFHPDRTRIVSASADRHAIVWDARPRD